MTKLAAIEVSWHVTRAESAESPFLFAGSWRNTHLHPSTISHLTARISEHLLKHRKIEKPFGYRDIRRTTETGLAMLGVSKDTRAQIESHGITGIQEKHYDRYDYLTEKLNALTTWEEHLTALASKVDTGNDRAWLDEWVKIERALHRKRAAIHIPIFKGEIGTA